MIAPMTKNNQNPLRRLFSLPNPIRYGNAVLARHWLLMGAVLTCGLAAGASQPPLIQTFYGASDPSAVVGIDQTHFAAADDEHNLIQIYSMDVPLPQFSYDLTPFLGVDSLSPEADIEGAARRGNRIYWITSHGRNKDGKLRPSRYRFFAMDILAGNDANSPSLQVLLCGKPYTMLLQDMLQCPLLDSLNLESVCRLDDALSKKQRQQLAPKQKGLNIEGLAGGPDGKTLWIGFRNPHYTDPADGQPKAILIPLLNPAEVIDKGRAAQFEKPILLNLGGRTIRSIEYVQADNACWISAGRADGQADFAFFRWHPKMKSPEKKNISIPSDITPEGIFTAGRQADLWVVSDDGLQEKTVQNAAECLDGNLLPNGRCPNKFLTDIRRRTFRAIPLTPPQ